MQEHNGKLLKRFRQNEKLSRENVAKILNVPVSTIFKIENGEYVPSESELRNLLHSYKVKVKKHCSECVREPIRTAYLSLDFEKICQKKLGIERRRYIGNKAKLADWIFKILDQEMPNAKSFCDLFAGTGIIASRAIEKYDQIFVNDILSSNSTIYRAFFGDGDFDEEKILDIIEQYNKINLLSLPENYFSKNYGGKFFENRLARWIGFVRQDIENLKFALTEKEYSILLASLIYSIDKYANTVGHFDAFFKKSSLTSYDFNLSMIDAKSCSMVKIFQMDANEFVKKIHADIVYLDPPYNSRQYCDAYHLYENLVCWKKPELSGVAMKFAQTDKKSVYCTKHAPEAFADLVKNIDAKIIVLSYNNMGEKGNGRSNAKISDEEILSILRSRGEVKVFTKSHRAFSAGKSTHKDNEERLFLCFCHNGKKNIPENIFDFEKKQPSSSNRFVQSPLNYTGGKFKLLPTLTSLFPQKITCFVDLFCGGGNVGVNMISDELFLNDIDENVILLLGLFRKFCGAEIIEKLEKNISRFGLSDSFRNGYAFYGCNVSGGLGNFNRNAFLDLRKYFNSLVEKNDDYFFALFTLVIFSFNNQIRFNNCEKFNLPVGKRDLNAKMRKKILDFSQKIRNKKIHFFTKSFLDFPIEDLPAGAFVYVDPPYLTTCATYNENARWTEKDEKDLLAFLNKLHLKGVNFAFSNILPKKNGGNMILANWLEENSQFKIHILNQDHSNANYQKKDRSRELKEILITNY